MGNGQKPPWTKFPRTKAPLGQKPPGQKPPELGQKNLDNIDCNILNDLIINT